MDNRTIPTERIQRTLISVPDIHNIKFTKRKAKRLANAQRTWKHKQNWLQKHRAIDANDTEITVGLRRLLLENMLTNCKISGIMIVESRDTPLAYEFKPSYRLIKGRVSL